MKGVRLTSGAVQKMSAWDLSPNRLRLGSSRVAEAITLPRSRSAARRALRSRLEWPEPCRGLFARFWGS